MGMKVSKLGKSMSFRGLKEASKLSKSLSFRSLKEASKLGKSMSFRSLKEASKLSKSLSFRSLKRVKGVETPRGYIPVAVGVDQETRRFMVHMTTLSSAEFLQFLYRSAEEYGFCNEGILRIPCDAKAFEEWMNRSGAANQRGLRIQPTTT